MSGDVIIELDRQERAAEEGVVVPLERISPDTLQRLVEEFVTREWSELADEGYTLDVKVKQVLRQLRDGKALVLYDVISESCNIVPADSVSTGTNLVY